MIKPPKYLVVAGKVPDEQKVFDFDDDSAARMFAHLWDGKLYENIKGNYLKIK